MFCGQIPWRILMLRKIVLRGIVGCLAGVVIGAITAALLMSIVPQDWIETWKFETNLDVHHLAWILWATLAGAITLLSICFGGKQLGQSTAFVFRGILFGCVAATMLTLVAAWFNDEWPFRVKAPQTMIDIGRNYLLPGFGTIGGVLGRIVGSRFEAKLKTPQNHEMHASCGSRPS
jgi:hypothetical protein